MLENTDDSTANSLHVQDNKIVVDVAVQTDDSDLFYTCYEHIEAQCQENLLTSKVLDETVDMFMDSLYHITDHLDKNFQFLTVQLWAEFNSYMQYALGLSTGEFVPVLAPHNFENPVTHNYPPIPV